MGIKNLYIASLESNAGSLLVSMGIMQLLKSRIEKLAFFRPIIEETSSVDNDSHFMITHFQLDQRIEESYGMKLSEAETLIAEGKENVMIERLIARYRRFADQYDFVLIEGLNRSAFDKALERDPNLIIAKNLQAPFISVISGKEKSFDQIVHEMTLEDTAILHEHDEHLALFVNRLDEQNLIRLRTEYSHTNLPAFFIPEIDELNMPSVGEIQEALRCEHILGSSSSLERIVRRPKIAAMNAEHLLEHLQEGDFVIVPGDRADIILTVLGANYAKNFPSIAGVLLCGGLIPSQPFLELLHGLDFDTIPVLSIETDTYDTIVHIEQVTSTIRPQYHRKIALAMRGFTDAVDETVLLGRLKAPQSPVMTPQMFEYTLFERARKRRQRIVLPESGDERILHAAEILLQRNAVDLILLGERKTVLHHAMKLGLDLSKATIINPAESELNERYITDVYAMRRHKGMTINAAKDALAHPTYFATMMVQSGDADGMVSGAIHTTQDTIRPALQIIKTTPDISLVSSLFFMCLDARVLVYADCAVNLNPSAAELAEIAIASAKSASMFGIEPRIAMLSYSTGNSGHGDDVEKVRQATQIVKQRRPDLMIEGPIQYDAAIDPDVARIKLPDSPVAGKATVFIFPDLNTGNNTYKAVQRSAGAIAIGPVLQGLNKPVNDLSRGCEIPDIVNTVLITAIQAQGESV
ncbi:MAG: phosphate acetyltransferase [Sulfuricurvum sp.]|uniref:phosphate acetyltransferase n=1 Tax=Sulfuricurvum sp. TaxID=2025608 RepID=UPI003D0B5818